MKLGKGKKQKQEGHVRWGKKWKTLEVYEGFFFDVKKIKQKKRTALTVPRWSPTLVLREPDEA